MPNAIKWSEISDQNALAWFRHSSRKRGRHKAVANPLPTQQSFALHIIQQRS